MTLGVNKIVDNNEKISDTLKDNNWKHYTQNPNQDANVFDVFCNELQIILQNKNVYEKFLQYMSPELLMSENIHELKSRLKKNKIYVGNCLIQVFNYFHTHKTSLIHIFHKSDIDRYYLEKSSKIKNKADNLISAKVAKLNSEKNIIEKSRSWYDIHWVTSIESRALYKRFKILRSNVSIIWSNITDCNILWVWSNWIVIKSEIDKKVYKFDFWMWSDDLTKEYNNYLLIKECLNQWRKNFVTYDITNTWKIVVFYFWNRKLFEIKDRQLIKQLKNKFPNYQMPLITNRIQIPEHTVVNMPDKRIFLELEHVDWNTVSNLFDIQFQKQKYLWNLKTKLPEWIWKYTDYQFQEQLIQNSNLTASQLMEIQRGLILKKLSEKWMKTLNFDFLDWNTQAFSWITTTITLFNENPLYYLEFMLAVSYLYSNGINLTDLHNNNIMVDKSLKIFFIDLARVFHDYIEQQESLSTWNENIDRKSYFNKKYLHKIFKLFDTIFENINT